MWCGGKGKAAEMWQCWCFGISCVCVCWCEPMCLRACLPLRGARPHLNSGFSGGAACSRWGHCTAPCINNSRRARESGGVCLPAQ